MNTKITKAQWLALAREAIIRSGYSPESADSALSVVREKPVANIDRQWAYEWAVGGNYAANERLTMSQNDKTYQGWTNYETWLVKLWMDNDQGSQEYWTERAVEVFECAEADHPFTKSEKAKLRFADEIKDQHEESYVEILTSAKQESSVWSDLLGAAMQDVNWHEIADSLLGEVEGYNKDEVETTEDK